MPKDLLSLLAVRSNNFRIYVTDALAMFVADYMPTFKQLLDTCTGAEMDLLCERYDGFYRFAQLLERLAEGIADGSIPVPE